MPAASDLSDAPWELLARHLAGEVSAPERAALRRWVAADPQHLQLLTTVTRAWERAGEAAAAPVLFSPADVAAAWQRFQPLLGLPLPPAPPAAAPPVAQPPWWAANLGPGAWVPAAMLAAAGLGALVLLRRPAPVPAVATYASTSRPRLVGLPDSTHVWLNAHSHLRYQGPASANVPGQRLVQLTGEAYFDVSARPGQPFVVNTAAARVRGAEDGLAAFNVRAYAAEDSADVRVTHGAVWLLRPAHADSLRLPAQHRAAVRAADAPGQVAAPLRPVAAASQNFRAWHTDTLRFADVPVAEVARALQVTYGTHISLQSGALGQCRFTGTFVHPQPARVLAVLAAATASRLLPDGRGGFVLAGSGCASPLPATPDSAVTARRP